MKSKNEITDVKKVLKQFYSVEGAERVGFIAGDVITEVKNAAENPNTGFYVGPEDIIKHTEDSESWATWHTHPNQNSNLSGEDHRMFLQWPNLVHFIIGSDGVKCYQYNTQKKAVLEI